MIRSGHVIVCGVGHLGVRTIIELRARDEEVVAIGSSDEAEETLTGLGVRLVVGDPRQPRVLRDADVAAADSIVMTSDDDLANLNTSLAATELNPTIRVVMRLFDQEVGAHIPDLFPDAVALSSSALAAPGFVSAAIDGETGSRFHLAGRILSSRGSEDPPVGERSVPIARLNPDRTVDVLPDVDGDGPGMIFIDVADPALAVAVDPAATRRSARPRGPGPITSFLATLRARLSRPERRLVRFVTILFGLAILSAIFFWVVAGLDPFDAVSYAITLLTGASLPIDLTRAAENGALRVYAIFLSLVGAAIVAVVYAFITDALIRSRLLQTLGRRTVPSNIHDHVIVAGLGSIGYRVAHGIAARGVPVVVVEVSEDGRFTSPARAAGIPVMVGDARHREVLDDLRLGTARALVAATSDDLVNLAIALNARAVRPDLRVVVRLFDPEFAMRIQRGFGIPFTRSVSHLAAPAFAAAAVRSEVVATVPLGDRRVVLFARLRVPAGSRLEGRVASSLDTPGSLKLLAVADPGSDEARWDIPADETLDADEEVVVVATRSGLSKLLLDASMVADGVANQAHREVDDLTAARPSGLAGVSGLVSDTAQRTVEAVVAGTTGAIGAGTQAVASVTGAASSVVGAAAGAAGSMAGAVKGAFVDSGSDQIDSGSDQVDGPTIEPDGSDGAILDRTPARPEE
jgi:Trk K+ transport system NAD-binding subunit